MKVGDVRRWDGQSDVYQQQYKVVESLGNSKYVIEVLPPDEEVYQRMLDHWAHAEANGYGTLPIWDKTWAECDQDAGERPQRIGEMTHEQMLERDIQHAEEWAGRRMTITVVSRDEWAKHF